MKKHDLSSDTWSKKTVAQTVDMYREWAGNYDDDLSNSGYLTPARCAQALLDILDPADEILDFGCGTGLSGAALKDAGFLNIDGCDITLEMLEIAKEKQIYRTLWNASSDAIDLGARPYKAVFAAGVISRGAAPAETLAAVLEAMPLGCHLVLSYNDPTLADPDYITALEQVQDQKLAELIFREHGPHIPSKNMGSDVILLKRL